MTKWIYKIEESFEANATSPLADFAATAAFVLAVLASFSLVCF